MVLYYWLARFSKIFHFSILVLRASESLQVMSECIFLLQFETHLLSSFYVHCIVVGTFGIIQMSKNLWAQKRWKRQGGKCLWNDKPQNKWNNLSKNPSVHWKVNRLTFPERFYYSERIKMGGGQNIWLKNRLMLHRRGHLCNGLGFLPVDFKNLMIAHGKWLLGNLVFES